MWAPGERLGVAGLVALPDERATGAPRLVPSTVNWTLPEGALPVLVTLALKVTAWPTTDGLADDLRVGGD